MDRLLTGGIPKSERKEIKKKMLDLVDIYYLVLDAEKSGDKITVPEELMVKQYPHLMERYPDYHSASVLGKIYDEVKSQESEADPSIKIVPLQCFTEVAVSEDYKRRWTSLYQEYLRESSKLCKLEDKAERNINFHELYQEYKWVSILLPNGRHLKFKGCPKSRQVFFFLAGFCRCCTRSRSLSTA